MNYTKQVLRGSIYFFIGSVIAAFIAYLTKLVLVRNLSVEDYGLFFAVFTLVLIFSVFRKLGYTHSMPRFIAEYNIKNKKREIKSVISGAFLVQLIFAGLIIIGFWFISDYLAINYFNDPRAGLLLKILTFYLPLSVFYINFRSIFQGLKKNKYFSLGEPANNLFVFICVLTGIYFGLGIYAPVVGYLGSFVIFSFVFLRPVLKSFRYFKHKHKDFFSVNKKLFLFGLPLVITSAGALIITYFDTLMLTYFDTLSVVGVYNIIYPTALLVVMIGSSIGSILMPIITELWSLRKKKEIKNALRIINKYLLIFCLPVIIVLMFFSRQLVRIFFGKEYLIGVSAFNILLIGALFKIFAAINIQTIIAFKEPNKIMMVFTSGAMLNVVLNFILIPKYSLNGAAVATALSFLLMLLISIFYVNKKIKTKTPWKSWIITLISSLVIPLSARLIIRVIPGNVHVTGILGLILGVVVYLGILWLFKVLDIKEVLGVVKKS